MTKYDLIRMLEPFDDEIEIVFHMTNTDFSPNVYYSWDSKYDSAIIILAVNKPNREKTVEIK